MRRAVALGALVSAMVLGWLGTVLADNTYDPRIHARMERQQDRISSGISSGALAPREARWTQSGLNHIRFSEARFSADGRLTMRERTRLHTMLDHESARIYRAKHNRIHW